MDNDILQVGINLAFIGLLAYYVWVLLHRQ